MWGFTCSCFLPRSKLRTAGMVNIHRRLMESDFIIAAKNNRNISTCLQLHLKKYYIHGISQNFAGQTGGSITIKK